MNNPFVYLRRPDIEQDLASKYFVQPKYFNRLISSRAAFIIGERGSGKTTILKYMCDYFRRERLDLEYVGVYFRFETALMKSLNNPKIDESENNEMFLQYMVVIFSRLLFEELNVRKDDLDEEKVCKAVSRLLTNSECQSFEDLIEYFANLRSKLWMEIRNGKYNTYIEYPTFLSQIVELLQKNILKRNICVCILLDEYENLSFTQQSVVNSLVKGSTQMITYKICTRPEGWWTRKTLADREFLMDRDDYETIDYVKDIIGDEDDQLTFVKRICERRLEVFWEKNIGQMAHPRYNNFDIESYLETKNRYDYNDIENISSYTERLRERVIQYLCESEQQYEVRKKEIQSFSLQDLRLLLVIFEKGKMDPCEILAEFLSKGSKYKNWVHNYYGSVYYLIRDENGKKPEYFGLNMLLNISNSNMRNLLDILYNAFDGLLEDEKDIITVRDQTRAVDIVAQYYYDRLSYIPVTGTQICNLVYNIGGIFKGYAKDRKIKKFEVNHFQIEVTSGLSDERIDTILRVLKDAQIWGILTATKATKLKESTSRVLLNKEFSMHPLLTHVFSISMRKKQCCAIKDMEINRMLEKPWSQKQINSFLQIDPVNDYHQIGIMEMMNDGAI